MRTYIIRRILVIPVLVIGVLTLVFLLTNLTPSRAIYLRLGLSGTAEEIVALTERYHLDKPIWYRYFNYLGRVVRGDLGESMAQGHPVTQELAQYLPASLELVLVSIVCIVVVGVALGIVSAIYKNRWPDFLARGFAVLGNSMPEFWFGLMLSLLFFFAWRLLPASGRIAPLIGAPKRITGMYMLDSLLAGNWKALGSSILHMILPVISLTVTRLAAITRMTRTSFLDVLSQDYMLTHRAYGFRRKALILRYGLKNAFSPILSVLGLMTGGLFASTFLIETVFSFPGIGLYAMTAIVYRDYQPAVACAVLFSLIYGVINVLVDIMYAWLDPRVRYN